jgi:hypothetical protein
MREKSVYEGKFDSLNGANCFGRVVDVDVIARTCRVKTSGLKGKTDDQDLYDVQWINLAAAPIPGSVGGVAEDTVYPTINSIGVITFINSEPYIIGYFRPLPISDADDPPDPSADDLLLNPGDRVITTIGGNSVILRAGGTVEISSNGLCRTFWIPDKNIMNSVCGDYELETDGGYMYWTRDHQTLSSTLQFMIWDNLFPINTVSIAMGTADDEGNLINIQAGVADPLTSEVLAPVFSATVSDLGDVDIGVGLLPQTTFKVDGATGSVTMTTLGSVSQTIAGSLTQTVETGDVSITAVVGNVDVSAELGSVSVKGLQGVSLSGLGLPPIGQVLAFPFAISDFSGAPVEVGSQSVKISP